MGYLKTGKALIESINETIELVELNAFGQKHLLEAHTTGDMFTASAYAVKFGTVKWKDKTPEEIMLELPLGAIQEIAEKVSALSGFNEDVVKKSARGSSSSD